MLRISALSKRRFLVARILKDRYCVAMSLLTPRQYAKLKGVHFSTVYRWIEDNKLAVIWQRKKVPMIPEDAIVLKDVKPE